jgi:tripartite-type tricarboxylate transporter receptor subunit TctC
MAEVIALACVTMPTPSMAQEYPIRTIRFVVPNEAGGVADIVARLLANEIASKTGKTVIVENKTGASGTVGAQYVINSEPDGYTLCFCGVAAFVRAVSMANPPFDPLKDLVPVTMVYQSGMVLATRPDLPATNFAEFTAYAKANSGKMTYGSPGVGSQGHLMSVVLERSLDVKMTNVPFRGEGAVIPELLANRIDFSLLTNSAAGGYGKQLRLIAALGKTRTTQFPDLPTLDEAGLKGFYFDLWGGVFAPARTPRAVIDKLHQMILTAISSPEIQARFSQQSLMPQKMGTEEFQIYLRDFLAKMASVGKDLDIQ